MGKSSSSGLPWRWSPPPASVNKRMFKVGSKVEARSEEDGFIGGWFEATITRTFYKQRRYAVSYDNIVADDAPDKPLRETLRSSLLRPRRPADPTGACFGIYQCVEAFHNEGWWPGVVCKLPDGGRDDSRDRLYSVYFPASREEFQFKASELRSWSEWVRRKWVSVEEAQEGVHVMFGEGTQVEVSRDKEHFGAAWFVGTVLKVIGRRYFLIEYENIRVDIDGGTDLLLKEIVDLQYIRPCPPASKHTSFDMLDEVEGFQHDGWFAGVVYVILPGSRYIVKYKYREGDMVLDHTSLRPACVWVDGPCVDISRDGKVKTLAPGRTKPDGRKRKSSSGTISVFAAGNDDHVGKGSNFPSVKPKKEDVPRKKRMIESSPVSKKSKEGSLRGSFSVHVPTYKEDDGEASDVSAVATCKSKEATEPGVKGGLELCESGKKLKAGNLLGETVSISKRRKSNASEQSNLSSPVLTSHKNDSEVYDTIGVTNLKDRNAEEPSFQDKAMLERSPALGSEELQYRSHSHEIYAQKSKVGSNSQAIPLSRELCHGQKTSKVTGTNESVINGKESYSRLGEGPEHQAKEANLTHLPVGHEAVDVVPIADGINGKGNSSPTKTTTPRRRKRTVRPSRRHGKTPEVDDVIIHHTPEVEEEHRGCITPEMKITSMTSNESKRLKEGTEHVVGCEENSLRNDETLSLKQSHIMVDACVTLIESSILNAESVRHSVVQQSPEMKALPTRCEGIRSCAGTVDEAEMENASIAPMPSGSLSSKENNVCEEQEFSPSRLLYDGPVVEKNPPCGSLPSNEDAHVHDDLISSVFPSGMSISVVSRRGEHHNSIMEPGDGLQGNVALESNQLASANPQSDGGVLKSRETTYADLLHRELSPEKLVLPFPKRCDFWELLESREEFRSLPQQPHFHPLHQCDEGLREGMAIGLMVTFANLVGDISSMRIVDSQQDFELKMKILGHLESHGFNVLSMRARLERLLQLRDSLIQLEARKQSVGAELASSEEEDKHVSSLVSSVEQTMSKLAEELAHHGKKRESLLHELSKTESKIAILKRGVQEAEESIASINREFNSVLAASW